MVDERILALLSRLYVRSANEHILHWLTHAHAALLNDDPSDALRLAHQALAIAQKNPKNLDYLGSGLSLVYVGAAWTAFYPPGACSSFRYAIEQLSISLRPGGKTNAAIVRQMLEIVQGETESAESADWPTLDEVPASELFKDHTIG